MIGENETIKLSPHEKRKNRQEPSDCHEAHTHKTIKGMIFQSESQMDRISSAKHLQMDNMLTSGGIIRHSY